MSRFAVRAVLVATTLFLAGCFNSSDPRIIEAAESLVPPNSEITDVGENLGATFESGRYHVSLDITDGGLSLGLVDAIEQQAREAGWEQTSREEAVGGTVLDYARDDLEADVLIATDDVVYASIIVRKADPVVSLAPPRRRRAVHSGCRLRVSAL